MEVRHPQPVAENLHCVSVFAWEICYQSVTSLLGELRQSHQSQLSKIEYEWIHVGMTGLLAKCHPVMDMDSITTAREVMKLPAMIMLECLNA